jgi:hypothetical protein
LSQPCRDPRRRQSSDPASEYSRIAAYYLERTATLEDATLRQQGEATFWLCIQALYNPMRYVEANLADLEQVAGIKEFARFAGVAKTPWGALLSTIASIIHKRDSGPGQGSAQSATPWPSNGEFLGKFAGALGPKNIKLIQDGLKSYVDDILAIMTARQIMKPSDQFVTDARARSVRLEVRRATNGRRRSTRSASVSCEHVSPARPLRSSSSSAMRIASTSSRRDCLPARSRWPAASRRQTRERRGTGS